MAEPGQSLSDLIQPQPEGADIGPMIGTVDEFCQLYGEDAVELSDLDQEDAEQDPEAIYYQRIKAQLVMSTLEALGGMDIDRVPDYWKQAAKPWIYKLCRHNLDYLANRAPAKEQAEKAMEAIRKIPLFGATSTI